MASTSTTETWDAAWTLTLRAHRKRLTDNFFDSYPTLNSLRQGNALEVESGGKEIQEDLLYGGNTAEFFSGYDVLNTDSVDGITAAFFPWRYCAVPITISMTEEQENKKSDAAMKLLAAKTEQSVLTMSDQINNALYSAQTGKSILGFQDIIADAPSSSPTTLGGITVSGNSWWQNKANNATADESFQTISNSHFYKGMLRMATTWTDTSEGNQEPTAIFTTASIYSDYEEIFEGTGYPRLSSKDKPGVDGRLPAFRGVPVQYDRDCGTGRMYFLNTQYLKLKLQKGMEFSNTDFREPSNQMAKTAFVIVGLQLTTNNRRRQGVIYNIND